MTNYKSILKLGRIFQIFRFKLSWYYSYFFFIINIKHNRVN